ncbi:hypothetical protein KIN20_016551 [Parelaphostrongylus tenuis]|uniref:Uncharacterized protein n=1 Tax=Parelaphostrongylus tenuis TaxID=148309 RepID=A0AAD5N220_PARTN|nr:hypothetical protein KIN20_016551 [Parelaphostrongylus tenuis]
MQTIIAVLEQQGHSAGLPDAIISSILNQLMVQISYDPLECKTVIIYPKANNMYPGVDMDMLPQCIVVGNTVTSVCTSTSTRDNVACNPGISNKIELIAAKHMSISGSFTTTNIIMANWSRDMWQGVINRAVRMLASSPFALHFSSAIATVV